MFRRWNKDFYFFKDHDVRTKLFFESTQNQCCFNVKFQRWFNVDKLPLFRHWNTVISSTFIQRFYFFKDRVIRTKLFLKSTQNQCCFNVEFYRWVNVDKSTLNQRGCHVDRRRDVISTYIKVESMSSVCWERACSKILLLTISSSNIVTHANG